ncbi:MAG: RNB domain-containing ribonuclease, partial [Bacilli bacterium]
LLAKYDISSSFPSYIEEEEKIISSRIFPRFFRERDLVRDYAITIDRKGALELDDALSAKILPNGNYLLGIHIADILGVVPFNSFSVQEALDQTTAIYFFCQRKISLFPKDIVETASLSERKYHLTKSYYFEIDKHGNYQVLPAARSITFINKNTTYSDINRILANGCYNNKLLETSILLDEITSSLQKKDPINPLYLALKDEDVDISHNREDHTKAGNIVRYSMLMLNKTVPLFFSKNGFPFLYRVQNMDPKAEETLNRIYQELPKDNTDPRYQQLMTQAKSIYGAARYDIKGSHSGLGLEHYCHISSTLRRSADIVASFCENKCYFNTPTDEDLQFLEKLVLSNAKHINAKKRGINDCYREYTQLENDKKALTTPKIMIK